LFAEVLSMRPWLAALAVAALPLGHGHAAEAPSAQQNQDCIVTWNEVRVRYPGYDHIVHLESHCSVRATCAVATNVNPETLVAEVPPGEHIEVLTFMGSPAREFTAQIECRLEK